MSRLVIFLAGVVFIVSCAGPPIIYTSDKRGLSIQKACRDLFPTTALQLVHSLEASFADRKKSVLVGVTDIYPRAGNIRSVIMTLEGLVLFEAEQAEVLVIHRAVAPFDSPAFAKGLMADIGLIFFNFPDDRAVTGRLENGAAICRYDVPEGQTIDTIIYSNGAWERKRYDKKKQLIRYVRPLPVSQLPGVIPTVLELNAYGQSRYHMKLTLIRSTRLD